jgi:N-terminal region of glycosyl transferase group 7/N-terminal domain of galactosyltransferase
MSFLPTTISTSEEDMKFLGDNLIEYVIQDEELPLSSSSIEPIPNICEMSEMRNIRDMTQDVGRNHLDSSISPTLETVSSSQESFYESLQESSQEFVQESVQQESSQEFVQESVQQESSQEFVQESVQQESSQEFVQESSQEFVQESVQQESSQEFVQESVQQESSQEFVQESSQEFVQQESSVSNSFTSIPFEGMEENKDQVSDSNHFLGGIQTPSEIVEDPKPNSMSSDPSYIFIVPYRDREEQYKQFETQMKQILPSTSTYRILYLHQQDTRPFNRGALKNIGFLVIKQLYPTTYQTMTLVFNDIDTFPLVPHVIDDYTTKIGTIKHFYGYRYTLGGIVCIHAIDFERINGYPNYWSWGYEDNMLEKRASQYGIHIDRSIFYPIHHPLFSPYKDGYIRQINQGEFERYTKMIHEGIRSLHHILYSMDNHFRKISSTSLTPEFHSFNKHQQIIQMSESHTSGDIINIQSFFTEYIHNPKLDRMYDIRQGNRPFTVGYSTKRHAKMNLVMS